MEQVTTSEYSHSESWLHFIICVYEPSPKPELLLHLSKGDQCLIPHLLLALAIHPVHLFAGIFCMG